MVNARDLKSLGFNRLVGSNPILGIPHTRRSIMKLARVIKATLKYDDMSAMQMSRAMFTAVLGAMEWKP